MTSKYKLRLAFILFIGCGIILFCQLISYKNEHERLLAIGESTNINSSYYTSWGEERVKYFFVTKDGQRIDRNEKCGTKSGFVKYINAKAIYNPGNPNDFELDFDFYNYSLKRTIILFFLLGLPAMTLIAYNFVVLGFKIYTKLKYRNK
jgi:hypothetical protein